MNGTLQGIKFGAVIGVSIFVYALPVFLYVTLGGAISSFSGKDGTPTLSEAMTLFAWYWALGPFVAGFLVARAARVQPLLHGVIVGVVGVLFESLFLGPGIWWLWLGVAALSISLSLFGAWLWRYRAARSA
jgi:hypothetical protein